MLAPFPFALHASTGCPAHAELAISLASAFHEVDAVAVDVAIDRMAEDLCLPESGRPLGELLALADSLLPKPPIKRREGTDALLLDKALARGEAHPLVAAIATAEAARRRGVDVGIVSNGSDHCIAHHGVAVPLVLRVESRGLVDAHHLHPPLTWRCAHEACGLTLDALEARWPRRGRPDLALLAAQLRLFLPLEDDSKRIAERRLARVRARFN